MHEVLFVTYALGVAYMRVRTRFLQRRLSLLLHTCPLQRGLDGSDALQTLTPPRSAIANKRQDNASARVALASLNFPWADQRQARSARNECNES